MINRIKNINIDLCQCRYNFPGIASFKSKTGKRRLTMPDTPKIPGLVQKKDGSYGFTVECPNGFITKEILKAAHEVCRNFNCRLHITTAQKLMFLDLDQESGARAVELLEQAGASVRKARDLSQPRVCVGKPYCKFGVQDSLALGDTLYNELARMATPPKLKYAVSGCLACCAWSNLMDLGFAGVKSGFRVIVGGHGGFWPKPGTEIGKVTSHEQAVEVLRKAAELFRQEIPKKGRMAKVIKKIGVEEVKRYLGFE
jgi:NAD(P)H-nitrite reductase large subunit